VYKTANGIMIRDMLELWSMSLLFEGTPKNFSTKWNATTHSQQGDGAL
jgi:hypothetical protein